MRSSIFRTFSSIPPRGAPAWPAGCARCRLQTARECLARTGVDQSGRITLVAEMEYPHSRDDAARMIRLQAYEKAGFRKIDPALIHYYQPDFRAPEVIDATGGARPLAFQLIVRRVGREHERVDLRRGNAALVQALYDIYAPAVSPRRSRASAARARPLSAGRSVIALLPPTQC